MIQRERPKLFKGDRGVKLLETVLDTFKTGFISGSVFVKYGCDAGFFKNECNLPVGISYELADLAMEIAGGETAGKKKSESLSFILCTPRRQQAREKTTDRRYGEVRLHFS